MKFLMRIPNLILAVSFAVSFARIQESEKPANKPVLENREKIVARVLVLDPDGHPLDGATVTPWALRPRQADSGHFLWNEDLHGPLPNILTNADGIAEVPVPKFVVEKLELGKISWMVDHSEFVRNYSDRSVDENPVQISVERGFRIALTAVDGETGAPIREDLYAMVSNQVFADWKLTDNGTLVSPVFAGAECVLRVVQMVEGQPVLFSGLIEITPQGKSRIMLKNVKLAKGVRVEGRLADDIQRPIRDGYVAADVGNQVDGREPGKRMRWLDRAEIDEDGKFVFESLPPNEVLQMIPICDGWVPSLPNKDSILKFYPNGVGQLDNNFFSLPQLIQLSNETVTPILEMEPGASVCVTVSDQDGNPVQSATVVMWPNQLWFGGGSQLLGASYPTRERLLIERRGESLKHMPTPYTSKTDKDGVAVISNLPVRRSQQIAIFHDQFEMPIVGSARRVEVELKPGEVSEIHVQLQKKGTELLGEKKDGEKDKLGDGDQEGDGG